jgi:hypothetical protein
LEIIYAVNVARLWMSNMYEYKIISTTDLYRQYSNTITSLSDNWHDDLSKALTWICNKDQPAWRLEKIGGKDNQFLYLERWIEVNDF